MLITPQIRQYGWIIGHADLAFSFQFLEHLHRLVERKSKNVALQPKKHLQQSK